MEHDRALARIQSADDSKQEKPSSHSAARYYGFEDETESSPLPPHLMPSSEQVSLVFSMDTCSITMTIYIYVSFSFALSVGGQQENFAFGFGQSCFCFL